MVRVGLFVRLQAKQGKEADLARFLTAGLSLAVNEPETVVWFALKLGASTFGIFDGFPGEAGRQAHLAGPLSCRCRREGQGRRAAG